MLDVAAGHGRHARWLAGRGCRVVAVDRDGAALATLDGTPHVETVVADLERDAWPFEAGAFDAVVVTNYLWRPLFPSLTAALAPGGVLLYETFADGQQTIGRPSRPEFLLRDGELPAAFATLSIVAYENVFLADPDRFVQRIAALESRATAKRT